MFRILKKGNCIKSVPYPLFLSYTCRWRRRKGWDKPDGTTGSKSHDSPCIDDKQPIDYYAIIWYFAGITIKIYRIKSWSLMESQLMRWKIIYFLLSAVSEFHSIRKCINPDSRSILLKQRVIPGLFHVQRWRVLPVFVRFIEYGKKSRQKETKECWR